jgi:hypothetical protein
MIFPEGNSLKTTKSIGVPRETGTLYLRRAERTGCGLSPTRAEAKSIAWQEISEHEIAIILTIGPKSSIKVSYPTASLAQYDFEMYLYIDSSLRESLEH